LLEKHGLASNAGRGWQAKESQVAVTDLAGLDLPLGARLLGLDLGEKTIGLALSDTSRSIATPMQTLKRGKFVADAAALDIIIGAQGIGGLVVGLPLNMDGSDGPSAQSARAFARNWVNRSPLPVVMWDERLSTSAVTRTLIDADASRRRRDEVVDKMAAAYILQGALDRLIDDTAPARFRWLPPGLRPPVPMEKRTERVILLVGAAAFFAGYDQLVFGLATPQIQAGLHIPENQIGLTVSYFRLATFVALLIAASADLIGRRRLLLVTLFFQASFTLLTAFAQDYTQFVLAQVATRIFGYAEEMLCFVVIAEEVAAAARGWSNGTLSALYYLGGGLAALVFMAVDLLPFGWRAIYVIGAIPLFLVAYLRQRLPETRRFAEREGALQTVSKFAATWKMLGELATQYPRRIVTVLIAAGAFGFAISPATVLGSKYLQSTYHYAPWQASVTMIGCGLVGIGLAILSGKLSDRIGRKPMAFAIVALAGVSFFFFYNGVAPIWMPLLWLLSFFGFFSGDVLVAGFALEIVPTAYRATVSGLRYVVEIILGAVSLALEGRLYDVLHAHAPAIQWMLAAIPITLVAILFLPEPAGKSLEEMA
jgi:putative transcription antitermination factor YqgF